MIGDADLASQFSSSDPFCVLGTFSSVGAVYGRFIEATEAVNIVSNEFEAFDNSFECRTSDVANVVNGNTVVIDGDTYTVERKQNLGNGISLIYLKT